jgi:hypothetical protein
MPRLLRNSINLAETLIGGAYAFVLAIFVAVCGFAYFLPQTGSASAARNILMYTAAFMPFLSEIVFMSFLCAIAGRGETPTAVALAMHQWRWPKPLRPIVVLWWAAHFLAAAFGVLLLELDFSLGNTIDQRLLTIGLLLLLTLAGCYAANIYLLLIVTAVIPRTPFIAAVWRWRLAVDAVAALAVFVPGLKNLS